MSTNLCHLEVKLTHACARNFPDIYVQVFSKDNVTIKTMVYFVYILQVLKTVLFTEDAFRRFATGFGDWSVLVQVRTAWFSMCIIDGIGMFYSLNILDFDLTYPRKVTCCVQSYYAWRISRLSGKKLPSIAIMLVCVSNM